MGDSCPRARAGVFSLRQIFYMISIEGCAPAGGRRVAFHQMYSFCVTTPQKTTLCVKTNFVFLVSVGDSLKERAGGGSSGFLEGLIISCFIYFDFIYVICFLRLYPYIMIIVLVVFVYYYYIVIISIVRLSASECFGGL